MQITLTGHHVEITDGINEAVKQRLKKISQHYPQLARVDVIAKVERHEQCIEMNTQGLSVSASNRDLYAALASATKKLDAALKHKAGAAKANLHQKPELIKNPADDMEDVA